MLKKLLLCFCVSFLSSGAFAESGDGYSVDDLLKRRSDSTPCATAAFARALAKHAGIVEIPDEADTPAIDTLAHVAFSDPEVLQEVLHCPELINAHDDDTIVFETVTYTFPIHTAKYPNGRKISINYETQKSLIKQKLLLATKKELGPGDISPDIVADAEKGVVWVNVDPAWYGIMVTEHGALDEFIQPGKNNVIAYRYIEDNYDKLYPKNHKTGLFQASCTSKSAWAGDRDMINRAVTKTVGGGLPDNIKKTQAEQEQEKIAEKNDYYVFGDADLRVVAYGEMALDIALTIFTYGGYAIVNGALKMVRGARIIKNAEKAIQGLRGSRAVERYVTTTSHIADIERAARNVKEVEKLDASLHTVAQLERNAYQNVAILEHALEGLRSQKASSSTIRSMEKELEYAKKYAEASEKTARTSEKIQRARQTLQNDRGLAEAEKRRLEQEIKDLKEVYTTQLKEMKDVRSAELAELEGLSDVKDYKELVQVKRESAHAMYMIRNSKNLMRNRGLLPVRTFRAAKTLRKGIKAGEKFSKYEKVVRPSMSGISSKVNDWLFHNTMKNITAITKVPASLTFFTTAGKMALDLYDYTYVKTGDFTNNIEIKPFLLLGADDLPGYENVVNYGMWLFWAGSSVSAADDDAAFIQAMGFADKFHQDLVELQDEQDHGACDVDIFVVRPIIRNPGTPNEEIYYLIMNDVPWSTHDFNDISSETVAAPKNGNNARNTNTSSSAGNTGSATSGTMAYAGYTGDTENLGTSASGITPRYIDANISSYPPEARRVSAGIVYVEPEYDGTKIGGPCTKASASGGTFVSNVYVTGRYADHPAFEKAMITKFRTEGGCGSHPEDANGLTCYGVSSRYFPQVKKPGFSRADAEDIAWNAFWKRHNIGKLPDAISGDVFMALWGTGSKKKSIGKLQEMLGLENTGVVDDATVEAAKNYKGDLRTQYLDYRERMFRNGNPTFRRGWLNGLALYRPNGCHTIVDKPLP